MFYILYDMSGRRPGKLGGEGFVLPFELSLLIFPFNGSKLFLKMSEHGTKITVCRKLYFLYSVLCATILEAVVVVAKGGEGGGGRGGERGGRAAAHKVFQQRTSIKKTFLCYK